MHVKYAIFSLLTTYNNNYYYYKKNNIVLKGKRRKKKRNDEAETSVFSSIFAFFPKDSFLLTMKCFIKIWFMVIVLSLAA